MYTSKTHTIFEGTSEIQQLVIARAIFDLSFFICVVFLTIHLTK